MLGKVLSTEQQSVIEHARAYLNELSHNVSSSLVQK
jgi:hypothetical protein